METDSSTGSTPSMKTYQLKAEDLAREMKTKLRDELVDDPGRLTDALHTALVAEANLELRQILTHLSGQLELALHQIQTGKAGMKEARVNSMIGSVERASALVDVFLDRAAAARLLIELEPEEFDLSEEVEAFVYERRMGDEIVLNIEPTPVLADRLKVTEVVTHLVTRFYFAARNQEKAVVSLRVVDDHVEGFAGLSPSHLRTEELMNEISAPFSVEDIGIDVPYARAVLERHGGTLFVGSGGDAGVGFGFTLPLRCEGGCCQ